MNNNWFTIKKVDSNNYSISEYGHWEKVHSHLLLGSKKAMLIDTGLGIGNIKYEIDKITELPVDVYSTHFHWDHIGGHKYFDQIMIHANEREWMINGLPLPISVIKENIMKEPFYQEPPKSFNIESYTIFTGRPTRILHEDCDIDLGNRNIKILHTPGHSPGHLSFYDTESKYLYPGDIFYKGTIYINYPSPDPEKYYKSIQKLAQLDIKRILPSHNDISISVTDFYDYADFLTKNYLKLKHGTGLLDFREYSLLL